MSNLHDGDHVHHGHQDDHHHLEAGEGRRAADLVGGTRMGTSCHLAYLLHIFTIAVIITGIVTQKSNVLVVNFFGGTNVRGSQCPRGTNVPGTNVLGGTNALGKQCPMGTNVPETNVLA